MRAESKTRIHVASTNTEENRIEDDEPGRRANPREEISRLKKRR
jgi:hypothetical protein